ncbi:AGE family epimerase/isomerase [Acholeplasma hippikon]|uniref:N-acylglucosamine 2-epimerase (GlcNAc 2-epimerase) n=1 Tax=Acholeplasma hippikon TaxID=264636 RepID=A0A449BLJ2_9MOLU|nr:AGE family epimerase/isomerase [Acholeplasma hippikon]VEU83306.1 N-acylglucosamine 2-epimerase (GlcNAc 2-epimerase) [Acholeplasma hippikon]
MQKNEIFKILIEEIYPFWNHLYDERGGFFGDVKNDGTIQINASKGALLQLRILWFYSRLYQVYPKDEVKTYAKHAYDFVSKYLITNKGTIWEVGSDFKVTDDTIHIYYQAFTVYALTTYYESFKDKEALKKALNTFKIMESMRDENGYKEQLNDENRLADLGFKADRTMNSILHIIEAYTQLYKVSKDKKVYEALIFNLRLVVEKIFNKDEGRLEVFFDEKLTSLVDYHSYGHDIEASWLLDLTQAFIKDKKLKDDLKLVTKQLAKVTLNEGFDGNFLITEKVLGHQSETYVWWPQAEAVIGFDRAYEETYQDCFKVARDKILENIFVYFKDKKIKEWYWELTKDFKPVLSRPLVSNWKCPYHNGRMLIELLKEI